MFTNRSILIGISLLVIITGGVYFSLSPNNISQGNALVESGNGSSTITTSTKNCPFETGESPEHNPVIINEITWMGTKNSANDEWIELKNISTSTASMAGWELVNQSEKIKVVFKSGAKIPEDDFYLLERGSADFLTGIKAEAFFTGSLKNNGDSFRLFDKDCGLVDEIISSSSWPAGDNASRKTMGRDSKTLSWHTSAIVGGTPKAENSQNGQGSMINDQGKAPNSKLQVPNNFQIPSNNNQTGTDTIALSTYVQDDILTSKSNVNHILISQVQITGGKGKTNDDFIELYNPTSLQANLKGYRLIKRAQNNTSDTLIKSWATNTFIPSYGFYLWANSSFTDISVIPDSMTSETLSDDNGVAIRLGPNDTGAIVDSISWGNAQNTFATSSSTFTSNPLSLNPFPLNPSAGQSLLRKSWQNGACLPSSLESLDPLIGNGCDTGNNALDFELNQVSKPRDSTKSLF